MNSPGHRANILDGKFDEIGVAVGKGMYEGKEVWRAVQEFGSPLSNCPSVSSNLKYQIEDNKATIARLEAELATEKERIDSNYYRTNEEKNRAIAAYNEKANTLNGIIDQTKVLVNDYNKAVSDFNSCLENNA